LFIILNFTDYKIIGELQPLTTVVERSNNSGNAKFRNLVIHKNRRKCKIYL
jgi:hypothetical protein